MSLGSISDSKLDASSLARPTKLPKTCESASVSLNFLEIPSSSWLILRTCCPSLSSFSSVLVDLNLVTWTSFSRLRFRLTWASSSL